MENYRRIIAPNPGPMTFTGTNTYILGAGAVAVIDPGPADPGHIAAILRALAPGERVSHILITHSHLDHSPGAALLKDHTGAPVLGFGPSGAGMSATMRDLLDRGRLLGGGEGVDTAFRPDGTLSDGDRIEGEGWALTAIHTPGHMSNHLCFAWEEAGLLVSGDHVMDWSTTLVSPPDGDLTAFMESLERIRPHAARARRVLPGHGEPFGEGAARVEHLHAHRRGREAQILAALALRPSTPAALTAEIYRDGDPALHPAALRNVFAHLIDLVERGVVVPDGPVSPDACYGRA